jgi:hypothetical protein
LWGRTMALTKQTRYCVYHSLASGFL